MDNSILPHLDELGIYQLRVLGREVGVALPTTLKRKDLINKIRAIISGDESPYVRKSNKGRPAKSMASSTFMKSREKIENVFGSLQNYYKTKMPDIATYESINPQVYSRDDEYVLKGFVAVQDEGYGYLLTVPQTTKEPIYVKISVIKRFSIETGDMIEAKILQDATSGLAVVTDVLKVNNILVGKGVDSYDLDSTIAIKKKQPVFSPEETDLVANIQNASPLYLGDRVVLSIDEKRSVPVAIHDYLAKLNASKLITHIVFVGNNVSQEFYKSLSNFSKVIPIVSTFGDAVEYSKKMFQISFEYAKKLAGMKGNNVVFLIQDLADCLNLFTQKEKDEVNTFCKKYFITAKQTQDSSLTCIYSFAGDSNLEREYVTNENLFVKYLPNKYLTKCEIKFNIVESFRTQMFNQENDFLSLQQKLEDYFEKGDYIEKHKELELKLKQYSNIDDLLNNL